MIAEPFTEGRFVIARRIRRNRIGMLVASRVRRNGERACLVQFSPSGPAQEYFPRNLKWATRQEVVDAGLIGVGHVEEYADA